MNRITLTVIAGCALTAIAAAVGTTSARADSLQPSDGLASAKDAGATFELSAKDAGKNELSAKDAGRNELAAWAKDGGAMLEVGNKDGGASRLGPR